MNRTYIIGRYVKGALMNSKQRLGLVEKAISDRKDYPSKYWIICYLTGRIQCVSRNCQAKPEIVFLTVSNSDIEHGFSGKQWDLLEERINKFWRQRKL